MDGRYWVPPNFRVSPGERLCAGCHRVAISFYADPPYCTTCKAAMDEAIEEDLDEQQREKEKWMNAYKRRNYCARRRVIWS